MPMRIPGMATGMDTDTMVKQMMQPYKMKVDKLKQDRDTIKWKQDMYRDIIKDVKGFYDKYLTVGSKDYILSSNAFSGYDVTNSHPEFATATGKVGAIAGNYTVNVQNLAESARLSSGQLVLKSNNNIQATLDTKLSELKDWPVDAQSGQPISSSSFTITCGGKTSQTIQVKGEETISQLINAVNLVQSNDDVANRIGMSQNMKAYFSELTGKITFETVQTGSSSSVGISEVYDPNNVGASGSVLNLLGIPLDNPKNPIDLNDPPKATITGKDAKVTITSPDGTATPLTEQSNSFTIDGICYNLNKAGGSTDIAVKPNAQGAVDKIKAFIGDYNKFIEKINNKIEEKKQYKYLPLTEDQRKDMKEGEIKTWEDAAKVGLLKNDNELSSFVSNLRTAFFDKVEGSGISLKQVGLDTSPDTSKRGQIVIDETKLKKALEENGDSVFKLFTSTSSSTDTKEKYDQSGVFQRMNDILYDNVGRFDGTLLQKAGIENSLSDFKNQYTDKITEKDKIIKSMEADLVTRENSYYTKFAALEKAMNNMNAQSSWLAAQLGGGGN